MGIPKVRRHDLEGAPKSGELTGLGRERGKSVGSLSNTFKKLSTLSSLIRTLLQLWLDFTDLRRAAFEKILSLNLFISLYFWQISTETQWVRAPGSTMAVSHIRYLPNSIGFWPTDTELISIHKALMFTQNLHPCVPFSNTSSFNILFHISCLGSRKPF